MLLETQKITPQVVKEIVAKLIEMAKKNYIKPYLDFDGWDKQAYIELISGIAAGKVEDVQQCCFEILKLDQINLVL